MDVSGSCQKMLTGVKVVSGNVEMSQRGKLASTGPSTYKNKDFCVCKLERGMRRGEGDVYPTKNR